MIISKHKYYKVLRALAAKAIEVEEAVNTLDGDIDNFVVPNGVTPGPIGQGRLWWDVTNGVVSVGNTLKAVPIARFLNLPEPDAFEGPGNIINLSFANTVTAGQPVVAGQIAGVTVHGFGGVPGPVYTKGEFTLSVKGVDASGDAAVNVGDALYFVAEDTPPISKKNTGVLFGYALSAVEAGATATDAKVLLK